MALMLGIDIGGTKVAVGSVTKDGTVQGEIMEFPRPEAPREKFVEALLEQLREARSRIEDDILGVGVGCAGTIDWHERRVVESPNLPLEDEPLGERIAKALRLPVVLDNDANTATLAEVRVGAAKGKSHVVMLTLGTGVGGGIVLEGRLYRGATGSAGELGHTIVKGDHDVCLCGRRGCLEQYASGSALERYARQIVDHGRLTNAAAAEAAGEAQDSAPSPADAPEDYAKRLRELAAADRLNGKHVGELALEGDLAARDAVAEVAYWLGAGLANLANIFNPDMIVIGGGLSSLGDLLLEPARKLMEAYAIRPNGTVAQVAAAQLGNEAGVVGAALVAWEVLEDVTLPV